MIKLAISTILLFSAIGAFAQDGTHRDGKTVFTQTCLMCHGELGNKGLAGAKDLTISTISDSLATAIVHDGKGAMMAYGKMLSAEELKNVVRYIKTLRAGC